MSKIVTTPDGQRHVFPNEASPDQIKGALSRYVVKPVASSPGPEPEVANFMRGYAPGAKPVPEMLPTVGGFLGGLVGEVGGYPGSIAGAGIGGSLGETGKEILTGQPLSARNIGAEGGKQAVFQAAGGALAKGAGKLAQPLMQKSLGIVASLAKRFKTTPEVIAKIVLENRFPVSAKGEAAAQAAGNAISATRNSTIQSAQGTVTAETLAQRAIRDAERVMLRPLTASERADLIAKVQDEADAILTNATHGAVPKATLGTPAQPASTLVNQFGQPAIPAQLAVPAPPSRYTPWETEQIKEVAASNARPAYRATQAAEAVSADPALFKQIASSARTSLSAIPGVSEQNAELANMKAARVAIHDAISKSSGEWTPLHVGPVSLGFKVSKQKIGDLALALTHPQFQALLQQSPRAAAALVMELVHTDQPDKTSMPVSPVSKYRSADQEAVSRMLSP